MKIVNNKTAALIENGHGPITAKFALINPENGHTLMPFCKCKDYFTDVFWSNSTNKPADVYGFKWQPNEDGDILKKDDLYVAVKLVDKQAKVQEITNAHVKGLETFLNKFEEKLKFKTSEVSICEEGKHIILKFNKAWVQQPYLISALFLFIRMGLKYDNLKATPINFYVKATSGQWLSPADALYFLQARTRIDDLWNGKIDTKQTFSKYTDSYSVHNSSGIVNYLEYKI